MAKRKMTLFGLSVLGVSALTGSLAFADSQTNAEVSSQENQVQVNQQVGRINELHSNTVVSSTVDTQNGDQNPYAVAIDNRPGSLTAGQVFVSNFSDVNGTNGAGSTIERIVNGQPVRFAAGANGPVAMAFSPKGPLWIANFGQNGSDGFVQVTTPNGGAFANEGGVVTNTNVQGPWGQAFAPGYTDENGVAVPPAFFVTGAQNGTVAAMFGFSPPNFNQTTRFAILGSGLAHTGTTANDIEGPQGMAWDASNHTLYVTSTADNSIRAFQWLGANTPNQGEGQVVYQGPALNKPVGLAIDPVNGDLLVVNQGVNKLVEIHLDGNEAHVVGQVVLDPTPVNPTTGAGSALFGLAATEDANGNLVVYYGDDNTNTLNKLSVSK